MGFWLELLSLPSRERGLKFVYSCIFIKFHHVAPLAGAWIEITAKKQLKQKMTSLPSRERGLKCRFTGLCEFVDRSLPSRERGLKFSQLF